MNSHEFSSWYDFHIFPRYNYKFKPAPNVFQMPPQKGRFPNPWTTDSQYYQGIFCVVYAGTLFGLLFFALAALWNLCKNRNYKPAIGAKKIQNYIISIALIFTVISLAFAISGDLVVNNVAQVLDTSYKKYKNMWDTANNILFNVYDLDDTLRDLRSDTIPPTRKIINEMISDVDDLKGTVNDFLSKATKMHWYSGSSTLKAETTLIVGQFTRFMIGCFIFWLLFMKPRWFYNTSLRSCGCVYILMNVALISIWIWCTVILVYTIIISDVCVDVPETLNEVKNYFHLDDFSRSVVDYYTIDCSNAAVSPFHDTIVQMQQYIEAAGEGLVVLQIEAKVRGGDFAKQVAILTPEFDNTNTQITHLESELVCDEINKFYLQAVGDVCSDLKSDIFLCLIFQWAAILLTVISRTCKCGRHREREVVVNEERYFGEAEPNIIITASAPKLTEDLNAHLLDETPGFGEDDEIFIKSRYRSSSNARLRSSSNASTRLRSSSNASNSRNLSLSNAS